MEFKSNTVLQMFAEQKQLVIDREEDFDMVWKNIHFHLENDAKNSSEMLLWKVLEKGTRLIVSGEKRCSLQLSDYLDDKIAWYEWSKSKIQLNPLMKEFYFPIAYGHEMIHVLDHHISDFQGVKNLFQSLQNEQDPESILECMLHLLGMSSLYGKSDLLIQFDDHQDTETLSQMDIQAMNQWLEDNNCFHEHSLYIPEVYVEFVSFAFEIIFCALNQTVTFDSALSEISRRKNKATSRLPSFLKKFAPRAWECIGILVDPLCQILKLSRVDSNGSIFNS